MASYSDTVDLYSDDGKLLRSDVNLERISPMINPAAGKIIDLTKRTINVNLGGIEKALKTGRLGKGKSRIRGRELDLAIIENKDAIIEKIRNMIQVEEGDDTDIMEFNNGNLLLVKVPSRRLTNAATYDAAITSVAS